MDADIDKWIDRIQRLIATQQKENLDIIKVGLTRAELITLLVLFEKLKEAKHD